MKYLNTWTIFEGNDLADILANCEDILIELYDADFKIDLMSTKWRDNKNGFVLKICSLSKEQQIRSVRYDLDKLFKYLDIEESIERIIDYARTEDLVLLKSTILYFQHDTYDLKLIEVSAPYNDKCVSDFRALMLKSKFKQPIIQTIYLHFGELKTSGTSKAYTVAEFMALKNNQDNI